MFCIAGVSATVDRRPYDMQLGTDLSLPLPCLTSRYRCSTFAVLCASLCCPDPQAWRSSRFPSRTASQSTNRLWYCLGLNPLKLSHAFRILVARAHGVLGYCVQFPDHLRYILSTESASVKKASCPFASLLVQSTQSEAPIGV